MIESRRSDAGLVWGLLLIAVGSVLLAQTLGLFPGSGEITVGALMVVGGLALAGGAVLGRLAVGAAVAGAALAGVGGAIVLDALWPEAGSVWSGPLILAAIGSGFLLVYLRAKTAWWAVIPAGALFSLAVVAGVTPLAPGAVTGAILLLGLAGTFAVVALLPVPGRNQRWAWIPALVLGSLGLLTLGTTQATEVFLPMLLIAAGAYLLFRAARGRGTAGGQRGS